MLVSTKMLAPSGSASNDLLSILGLRDELLNPRMFPDGQSSKGIIYNAASLPATTCGGTVQAWRRRLSGLLPALG